MKDIKISEKKVYEVEAENKDEARQAVISLVGEVDFYNVITKRPNVYEVVIIKSFIASI